MSDTDRSEILALFRGVFDAWNLRDASGMAARFDEDGELIAFDGSELRGRNAIEAELRRIFSDHPTGTYVASVRDIDQLHPAIAVVRAVAGLVPPGQGEIDPKTEMVVRVLVRRGITGWRIVLFHNTPAQEPREVARVNEELRAQRRDELARGAHLRSV